MASSSTELMPFDLPEIRTLIGSFLDHGDRITCSLINKAWHETMVSLLWEKITLVNTSGDPNQPSQAISIPVDVLQKNADLVKSLTIQSELCEDYYDIHFPILQTVSFWPKRQKPYINEPSLEAFEGLAKIIKKNASISQLKLGLSKGRQLAPDKLWQSMAQAPNLVLLEALRMRIRHSTMPLFWEATKNLKALIVNFETALRFTNANDGTGGPYTFTRLRRLSLQVSQAAHISEDDQIQLMNKCPQLETLDWFPGRPFPPGKFLDCFRDEKWPNLEGLTMAQMDEYDDADIKFILESMHKKISILGVPGSGFGPRSFEVLRPHLFSGIIELDLSFCSSVTSAMIVDVLVSSKKLRKFAAGCVSAKDIVNSPPWRCGSLRELWIYFDINDDSNNDMSVMTSTISDTNPTLIAENATLATEQTSVSRREQIQRQILERIAGLEMLQSFSFSDPMHEVPLLSLDLKLGKGLELLSTLQELKGIHFHGTKQWMRTEDVQWMLDHWPHFHWMGGIFGMPGKPPGPMPGIILAISAGLGMPAPMPGIGGMAGAATTKVKRMDTASKYVICIIAWDGLELKLRKSDL
ncbi:hypothetical protein FBU30_006007 [Linnemannia zychae]|nr:hypothetical protein FBU30_006007 [Linnemannia zychae]